MCLHAMLACQPKHTSINCVLQLTDASARCKMAARIMLAVLSQVAGRQLKLVSYTHRSPHRSPYWASFELLGVRLCAVVLPAG